MKKIILSSAIVLSLAGTAIAQTPTTFADVDADTSGELSLTELQTVWPDMTDAEFGPADTDASGGLTVAELNALQAAAAPAAPAPAADPAAPAVPADPAAPAADPAALPQ